MQINGRETFRFAVVKMAELVESALKRSGLTMDDVALIVPHQVNSRILQAAAERLGVGMDKIYTNIDRYGNTSAASVPIALDEAAKQGPHPARRHRCVRGVRRRAVLEFGGRPVVRGTAKYE